MSQSTLYRKIKTLSGQSINEFVRSIRLKRAAQLLQNSSLTVTEIVYQVGFSDLKYFRKCFKEQFDEVPSKYGQNREDEKGNLNHN